MIVQFESEALIEYQEAADYSERRFGFGVQFVQAVQNALDTISNDPGRFQNVGHEVRIFRMRRFPYYIFYHFDAANQAVIVYALAHHKRKPDYWKKRLPGK